MTPTPRQRCNWRVQVVDQNRCYLHSPERPLVIASLYACYAAIKCSNQVQQTNKTLYYRFLTVTLSRASYSQTCSDTNFCGTPAQRNRNAPYSSPRDKSTGIRHCWHRTNQLFITINTVTRIHGLHRYGDTTPAQNSSMLTADPPEEAEYLSTAEQRRR